MNILFGLYDIVEREEYDFLVNHPNSVLIGDADNGMVVALNENGKASSHCFSMKNVNLNFPIYILRDDKKNDYEGPFGFLDLLKSLEPYRPPFNTNLMRFVNAHMEFLSKCDFFKSQLFSQAFQVIQTQQLSRNKFVF